MAIISTGPIANLNQLRQLKQQVEKQQHTQQHGWQRQSGTADSAARWRRLCEPGRDCRRPNLSATRRPPVSTTPVTAVGDVTPIRDLSLQLVSAEVR